MRMAPESTIDYEISYELYYSSALGTKEVNYVAEQIAQQMVQDNELTTYPEEMVKKWLETEPCIIALDNRSLEYLGGVILKRIFDENGEKIGYQMIGLNVPETKRGVGIGRKLFENALLIAEEKPIIVESTNPAVHHLCEKYKLQRKRDTQLRDPAWSLRNLSYRQIASELNQFPKGKATTREVVGNFASSMLRYKWYVSDSPCGE